MQYNIAKVDITIKTLQNPLSTSEENAYACNICLAWSFCNFQVTLYMLKKKHCLEPDKQDTNTGVMLLPNAEFNRI